MDAAPGCRALRRSSVNILTAWPGRVRRHQERVERALHLVLLTMLPPILRTARLRDQLQLDDEVNSEIADRYYTGSSGGHVVAVGDLPTSSAIAVQLVPE